ncbi:MAG: branched-chain amino acid transporter AzlC [Clostridiaceae bacterium]|nr:branched-chain amino acid transporter AzlC [Clostridiaceae bacterium]
MWTSIKGKVLKTAFIDTLPILAAYIILGMGFGVLMSDAGYPLFFVLLMSIVIFAGSMQYVAVSLLAAKASPATALLMTFLVNARHLFYGLSMLERYENTGKVKPYLIFGLTDETYSLVCSQPHVKNENRTAYFFTVTLLNHLYWIAGGAIGNVLGSALPFNSKGIEFSMTALFTVIFLEQWKETKDHAPALIGIAATAVSRIVFGSEHFLIAAMIIIAVSLLLLLSRRKEDEHFA